MRDGSPSVYCWEGLLRLAIAHRYLEWAIFDQERPFLDNISPPSRTLSVRFLPVGAQRPKAAVADYTPPRVARPKLKGNGTCGRGKAPQPPCNLWGIT